jgi:hypothetical protein
MKVFHSQFMPAPSSHTLIGAMLGTHHEKASAPNNMEAEAERI